MGTKLFLKSAKIAPKKLWKKSKKKSRRSLSSSSSSRRRRQKKRPRIELALDDRPPIRAESGGRIVVVGADNKVVRCDDDTSVWSCLEN